MLNYALCLSVAMCVYVCLGNKEKITFSNGSTSVHPFLFEQINFILVSILETILYRAHFGLSSKRHKLQVD